MYSPDLLYRPFVSKHEKVFPKAKKQVPINIVELKKKFIKQQLSAYKTVLLVRSSELQRSR
jgi:hypothetical protein